MYTCEASGVVFVGLQRNAEVRQAKPQDSFSQPRAGPQGLQGPQGCVQVRITFLVVKLERFQKPCKGGSGVVALQLGSRPSEAPNSSSQAFKSCDLPRLPKSPRFVIAAPLREGVQNPAGLIPNSIQLEDTRAAQLCMQAVQKTISLKPAKTPPYPEPSMSEALSIAIALAHSSPRKAPVECCVPAWIRRRHGT